ncbi:MAG: ABC transporter permease [Clostridiaceae bacterium]|jgi:ABC-2 type transport system permease protein|nr:ABC transporter permease [Clostridiaceae bacterium]
MFAHIFLNRLKCLLRDKETIFWTFAFPLALALFFYLALSNIGKGDAFQGIDIAVVNDSRYQEDQYFRTALEEASKGDDRLFNLTLATGDEAKRLLDDNSIKGYIIDGTPMELVVKESGIHQSIIKSFLDNYSQTFGAVETVLKSNPQKYQEVIESLKDRKNYIKEVSGAGGKPDIVVNFFYTLIAMACMYGSFFGMRETTDIQADISPLAARINIAPVHKLKAFLSSMCAALLIHFIEMLSLLAFVRYVLNIDFGPRAGLVLLTTIIGSIAGVFFGAFVSAVVKKSEGIKIAVLIGVSMLGSFLAGMMSTDIKYTISRNAPIISWINPVNLLTDAFYSLYYLDNLYRYALNIGVLSGFTVLFSALIYLIVRRRKYASL